MFLLFFIITLVNAQDICSDMTGTVKITEDCKCGSGIYAQTCQEDWFCELIQLPFEWGDCFFCDYGKRGTMAMGGGTSYEGCLDCVNGVSRPFSSINHKQRFLFNNLFFLPF